MSKSKWTLQTRTYGWGWMIWRDATPQYRVETRALAEAIVEGLNAGEELSSLLHDLGATLCDGRIYEATPRDDTREDVDRELRADGYR